jgi:hypothetical protein
MYHPAMKLAAALTAFGLVACAANGEVKVKASSDDGVSGNASATSDEKPTSSKPSTDDTLPPPSSSGSSTPVTSDAPPASAACPLVCYIAQHGRVPPADEQKLASDLSQSLSALRACGPGNSLTLRFDSTGQLSEFGVAADRGNESACTDGVRSSKPTVSYPGPSTLRCSERCGNQTTTGTRRGRRRP